VEAVAVPEAPAREPTPWQDVRMPADPLVDEVVAAARRRDRARLTQLLHPYVHWTTARGTTIRGRTNVLAVLALDPALGRAASVELRDGQVYRWRPGGARPPA
jgi:hypothetical protein